MIEVRYMTELGGGRTPFMPDRVFGSSMVRHAITCPLEIVIPMDAVHSYGVDRLQALIKTGMKHLCEIIEQELGGTEPAEETKSGQ